MNASAQYGVGDTSFNAAGGVDGILKLVEDFYHHMCKQSFALEIRAMHPDDLSTSIDKLHRFLCGWLGGPRLYQERYGNINVPAIHSPFSINQSHAEAWLRCMSLAIDEQDYDINFCDYLKQQLAIPVGRILAISNRAQ